MADFPAARAPAYRADIDGLRAIAVTSVVLYHAGIPGLDGGFAGVDVFFVISGFLIGTIIFEGVRGGSFSFADFYARRARRILPALIAVVLATMALGAILLSAAEFEEASMSSLTAVMAISNIRFERSISYFNPNPHDDPMLMTWSLAVEEQFYLALPFILIGLRRFSDRAVLFALGLMALASLAYCLHLAASKPSSAFYLFPPRAWELLVGVMLGVWVATGGRLPSGRAAELLSIAALVAMAAALSALGREASWPGWLTLVPVAATAVLIATPGATINRKLLSAAPMVGIGLISYSWYLWHWPLLTFVRIAAIGEPTAAAMIAAALLSLVIACLSWRFIERPFRKGRSHSASAVRRYAIAMGAAGMIAAVPVVHAGLPSRVPPQANRIDRAVKTVHDYWCMYSEEMPVPYPACVHLPAGKPVVVLIGDSHATALAPAVVEHAERSGQGWAIYTMGSCRPLAGVTLAKKSEPAFAGICEAFLRDVLARTRSDPRVRDVILVGLWSGAMWNADETYIPTDGTAQDDQAALLAAGLGEAARMLVESGKRVHVAQGTPYWEFDPASAELSRAIPARKWLAGLVSGEAASRSEFGAFRRDFQSVEEKVALAARAAGASYVRVGDAFCEGQHCRYRRGDTLYFVDNSHLSPAGAALAMETFEGRAATQGHPPVRGSLARQSF